jgi:hypothetical protein
MLLSYDFFYVKNHFDDKEKHVFAKKIKEHMTRKEEFRLKIPDFLFFFMDVFDNYNKIK